MPPVLFFFCCQSILLPDPGWLGERNSESVLPVQPVNETPLLAPACTRLGNALKAQGNLSAAAAQYQQAFEVAQKLVNQDPGNGGWQADLSDVYSKLG
jgi:hypothetical protein